MAECIGLIFGMGASFDLSYTEFKEIQVPPKKGTSSGGLPQTLNFKKFCHNGMIVEKSYQLSSTKVDTQSMINWIVVGQLS